MLRLKFLNKRHYLPIVAFLIISFLSTYVLFRTHTIFGSWDLNFHIKRIIELEKSLSHGIILPSFTFNEFHGSAAMICYPSINILPITIAHIFFKSNIDLIYLFIDSNIFISLIVSYYSSLYVSHSKKCSFIFSVVYSTSYPFLFYSFYSTDLGALTSISILPLVLFGFIILIYGNKNKECVKGCDYITIGSIIIFYSHFLSTLIIVLFGVSFLLINVKRLTRIKIKLLCKTIVVFLMITSIIWVPFIHLELSNVGNIYLPNPQQLKGVSFLLLFHSAFTGYAMPYLSIFAILGVILPLIFYSHLTCLEKQLYFISIIVLLICSSIFPWQITHFSVFKLIEIFQFTYRFYIIPEVWLSYLFSLSIIKFFPSASRLCIILITLLLVICGSFIGQSWYVHNTFPRLTKSYMCKRLRNGKTKSPVFQKDVYTKMVNLSFAHSRYAFSLYPRYKVTNNKELNRLASSYSNLISEYDYYPIKSLNKINYINNNEGIYNNGKVKIKHIGFNKFEFNVKNHGTKLTMPFVYYNGEKSKIYINHHSVKHYMNKNNMLIIRNVHSGKNIMYIKNVSNNWEIIVELLLMLLGLLCAFDL